MKMNAAWAWALLPAVATIAVLGVLTTRYVMSDGSDLLMEPAGQQSTEVETVPASSSRYQDSITSRLSERFPLANFGPPRSEAQLISGSQLIVIARISRVIGEETIPPVGQELVTPSASEPPRGVKTTKYALEVERYIKGKSPASGDTLILQVLSVYTPPLPLNERLLLFLVPYQENTFQAGALTILRETDGGVIDSLGEDALGEIVNQGTGVTLDSHADRLSTIVHEQAIERPPVALRVALVLPGETITPAHFLGLQNTRSIELVTAGGAKRILRQADVTALVEMFSQSFPIVSATESSSAPNVRVVISLDDGHIWELDYDTASGLIIYPPAGIGVYVPAQAQKIISSALGISD